MAVGGVSRGVGGVITLVSNTTARNRTHTTSLTLRELLITGGLGLRSVGLSSSPTRINRRTYSLNHQVPRFGGALTLIITTGCEYETCASCDGGKEAIIFINRNRSSIITSYYFETDTGTTRGYFEACYTQVGTLKCKGISHRGNMGKA